MSNLKDQLEQIHVHHLPSHYYVFFVAFVDSPTPKQQSECEEKFKNKSNVRYEM